MNTINKFTADILVIGSGLAGIRATQAIARRNASVISVGMNMSASPEIMGFNAVVSMDDNVDLFYDDIMQSGRGINNKKVAYKLAEGASHEITYLEKLGFEFDKNPDGSYQTLHTLGCKYPRLVHYKALTGLEAARILKDDAEQHGAKFMQPIMITELIRSNQAVVGAVGVDLNNGMILSFQCKAVVLATGGSGDIYKISTYPRGIAGDGYAIAYRAGAELVDMEFQQYEPCCFVYPERLRGQLVPTTLLRAGAKLYNANKTEFMENYGLSIENVQKGELSRAIAKEVSEGRGTEHGGVYYDLTSLPRDLVVVDHCIFYDPALQAGLDLTKEAAEMAPAAHTLLGGVKIDENGATSVKGLFAAGEVTGGVHGANRIGGCAGGETLVFGGIAGNSAALYADSSYNVPEDVAYDCIEKAVLNFTQGNIEKKNISNLVELRDKLGIIMMEKVGIIRNEECLKDALEQLDEMEEELSLSYAKSGYQLASLYQCKNRILAARMQILASLSRTESRGVFFRSDYPEQRDDIWNKNIIIKACDGKMTSSISECI